MFNYNQATKLYLSDLRTNEASACTLGTYERVLRYYQAHCEESGLDASSPAAVAAWKADMSAKGNKLVTISMYLNILHLFFVFCIRMKLLPEPNPVLPELLPPRKKIRAERKPYDHLMGEAELAALFQGTKPKGGQERHFLRNRAIVMTLIGCGLRNTELRTLTVNDLVFGNDDEAKVIVRSGKGGKFRITPFPAPTQQAIKAYLESGARPSGMQDAAPLFGVGETSDEWHAMGRDALSDMCKRYIQSATGFPGARSHACRHAFASFNLTHGVPMAEIQSMLGHSSIMTTEHYAALLRPTAPTASGNRIFNDLATAP